mmetsp:Transcript_40318/g.94732  ORF Transcript_40318/g.94732 Transcript_40318/m.94732 type:complete len:83 (-) Transcript_40318:1950-2198(-)
MGNDIVKAGAKMKAKSMLSAANDVVGFEERKQKEPTTLENAGRVLGRVRRQAEIKKEYEKQRSERQKKKTSLTKKWEENRKK